MKRFLILAPILLCAFTYGYKNNPQTGKPDMVVTGADTSDVGGFASYTTSTNVKFGQKVPYTGATSDVDLGTHAASAASVNVTGTAGAGYITLKGQSANPTSPAAGTLLLHSSTANGFTRMEQDNEAATNLILGRDNVIIAKNTSGSSIAAGQPVYVTGSTGNVPNIALAKANAIGTLPAIGVALDAIGNNNFGQVMKTGIISGVNTSSFSAGNSLWVSAATAGALVNTRPATPNLVQRIGTVLVSGVGNGSIQVVTAPFVGGMETGTTSASFATSTGSNTLDVTIGTANGLSLSGQVINLQSATNSQPGAMTAADHTTLGSATQPHSANTASIATGVPVTLFSAPVGVTIVSAVLYGIGGTTFSAVATVINDNSGVPTIYTNNALLMSLALSGTDIQATQNSGVSQVVRYTYLNIPF